MTPAGPTVRLYTHVAFINRNVSNALACASFSVPQSTSLPPLTIGSGMKAMMIGMVVTKKETTYARRPGFPSSVWETFTEKSYIQSIYLARGWF